MMDLMEGGQWDSYTSMHSSIFPTAHVLVPTIEGIHEVV